MTAHSLMTALLFLPQMMVIAASTTTTTSTVLQSSRVLSVDALVMAVEVAARAVDDQNTSNASTSADGDEGWMIERWDSAVACLRRDYVHMNATCDGARRADVRDPCSVVDGRKCPAARWSCTWPAPTTASWIAAASRGPERY